ncbi:MAG TPA: dihydrofolate reductase family protein [Actinomycetes bacterium]|nr:dihydrofolate reductase family protein [Actinomycetes bacterium]
MINESTPARPRLSVFIASSLDGYIATLDGDLGWLESAARADEDYGYEIFLADVDALAMGRGTYDHIAHLEPLPFGDRPVFVFTHRPPADRSGVTFWQETPESAVDKWSTLGLNRIYVDGGNLISDFLAVGLIDDMVLTKVPLLLGQGLPLFRPMAVTTGLRLVGVRSWPSGMVNLSYARLGVAEAQPTLGRYEE